jgi:hypothetical protein
MRQSTAAATQLVFSVFVFGCSCESKDRDPRDDHEGAATGGGSSAAGGGGGADTMLIEGVDLAVWDRYLGKPLKQDVALGLNNDPDGVYSIVTLEGESALRISGEVWGSLISKREFCNFRLKAEFKWGSAVWPRVSASQVAGKPRVSSERQ